MTDWQHVALSVADRQNPLISGPGAPMETVAALDAFGPSLMPRASVHQGMAAGLAILAARAATTWVEWGTRRVLGPRAGLPARLTARAVVGGAGLVARRIPEHDDESALRVGERVRYGSGGHVGDLAVSGQQLLGVARLARAHPAGDQDLLGWHE